MSSYRALLRKYYKQMRRMHVIVQIIASLMLPIIEGYLVNGIPFTKEAWSSPLLFPLGFVICIHGLLIIVLLTIDAPPAAFFDELDKSREDVLNLEGIKRRLLYQRDSHLAAMTASVYTFGTLDIIRSKGSQKVEVVMNMIIEPWKLRRTDIWGYQADSLWNFVLYWVSTGKTDATEMKVVWRSCDDRITPINRTWGIGDGHIGRCWRQKEMQISPPGFIDSPLRAINQPREEDDVYYASVLAVPVIMDGSVWGVLVITSSVDGQFTEGMHGQSAQSLARLISQGLSQCKQDGKLFANAPARTRTAKTGQ